MNSKQTTLLTIIGLIIFGIGSSLFIVQETEQVLVLQFGDPRQEISKPGLHFKIPVIQNLKSFERRILNIDPPAEELLLADQKRLVVDTFARYKISNMLKYYQTLNTESAATQRMGNIINAALRGALGKASLPDVLSEKRIELLNEIQAAVNKETERFGIEIVDIRIVRADLPSEVTQATYNRMVSEREREAREARAQGAEISLQIKATADKDRTVLLSEAQKEAQIIRAKGDQRAVKIYADAANQDPKFYGFYRSLEAYKKVLADPSKTLVLTPDGDFFKYLGDNPSR
ncbi:MAG: protease modulator HflC [Alphaproteobacteria bacterium]|nr:protease modulator HflC [Alphaproteobacteria bacterium]